MTNELKSKLESFLKRNPDGFTMKLADGVLYTGNMFYAVGLSHITDISFYENKTENDINILIEDIIAKFKDTYYLPFLYAKTIGGWHDVDTGQDCVDYGVIVLNEDVALSLAKFCNQKAIYDFEKQESVFIGE